MNFISNAYAQQAASAPQAPGGALGMVVPFVLVIVIFYFLIFRPQQKQQKLKIQMISNLKRGDEVVTESGIYGKINDIKETQVMVQIANNVIIKIDRAKVGAVLSPTGATSTDNNKTN